MLRGLGLGLNTSPNGVALWERGERTPEAISIQALSQLHGVPVHLWGSVDLDAYRATLFPAALIHRPGRVETERAVHVDEVVVTEAKKSVRFTQRAETTNVGPTTLEQLYAGVERIVSTYPNQPVLPLFRETAELRDHAFDLIEGRQQPRQTRDLYLITGWLCGILANASFDIGQLAAAETQARAAWLCADLAGHNGLRAWVRGMQGLIYYWSGRPEEAATVAESGWQFVPEAGTARVRLACIEARARAQAGDAAAADLALRRGGTARDEVMSDDVLSGMLAFPLAKQHFYASTTHLWLGGDSRINDAEREANEAVRLYQSDLPGNQRIGELCLARLDLSAALLGRGELDTAAHQTRLVLEAATSRPTDSVTERLRYLLRLAADGPYRSAPEITSLEDDFTTFLSKAAAPRLLPSATS
jgi:hypothetical protein